MDRKKFSKFSLRYGSNATRVDTKTTFSAGFGRIWLSLIRLKRSIAIGIKRPRGFES
jgi:hypothetical protein